MTQLGLLDAVEREERPWKIVRRVSKLVYARLRDSGQANRRSWQVITALAYYRNRSMAWPTAGELTRFMYQRKKLKREDPRLVAPRLTEMLRGKVVRLPDGSKVRRGGGLLTLLPARTCQFSGATAHPVAIREAGSLERQVA